MKNHGRKRFGSTWLKYDNTSNILILMQFKCEQKSNKCKISLIFLINKTTLICYLLFNHLFKSFLKCYSGETFAIKNNPTGEKEIEQK